MLRALRRFFAPTLCPVCGSELDVPGQVLCPLCLCSFPFVRAADPTDNRVLRLLWASVDVRAGGALMYYNHSSLFHRLIIRIKYRGDFALAQRLGEWACRELDIAHWASRIDAVVPMPAGKSRLRKYGYNQTLYLSRGIASELHCPVEELLRRTDSISSQTHRTAEERAAANISVSAHVPERLRGATILLVDDVITTGSTMRCCALALQKSDPTMKICVFALSLSSSGFTFT